MKAHLLPFIAGLLLATCGTSLVWLLLLPSEPNSASTPIQPEVRQDPSSQQALVNSDEQNKVAEPEDQPDNHFTQPTRLQWLREMGLTRTQLRQMHQIRLRNQQQIQQKTLALREARRTLRLLLVEEGSEADIRAQFNEVQRLEGEVTALRFETTLAIRELLTPTQREQMIEAIRSATLSQLQQRDGNRFLLPN